MAARFIALVVRRVITATHRAEGAEAPGAPSAAAALGTPPAPQGARRDNTRSIRPTSNAAGRDASAAECSRNYAAGHLASTDFAGSAFETLRLRVSVARYSS